MAVTALPRITAEPSPATRPRWTPSRAGIVNVWRYYDEVFEFHNGRLLLRGPNGTGKSKALELLLPFLFDANLRANRLSTFGTGERTMHWNLMGEGSAGTTRVGYVWLEFLLPGTPQHWFTCGARLQASTHTTTVHADYFTTSQRVATEDGLSLVNSVSQPLTRIALEQALGEYGVLHPNATDYRCAVRSTLFPGMTEQRYDALITALLQLRTPKLSQRLDPALLSALLSRALPPLGHSEIAELAEGFERLDRQREQLKKLDAEVDAARTLAARQKSYAQRVLRAAAAALISATTELDNLTRAARRSEEEHREVAGRKVAQEHHVEMLTQRAEHAEARITGLAESEDYKQGRELDRLRQRAAEAARAATAIRIDATRKRADAETDGQRTRTAQSVVEAKAAEVERLKSEALRAATRAGLMSVHAEIVTSLAESAANPRALLRAAVRGRHDQLAAVRVALDDHGRAVELRRHAEAELDQARTDLTAATERRAELAERYEAELIRLAGQVRAWAGSCRELVFADPDALDELIESESALLAAVEAAATAVSDQLTRAETIATAERDVARRHRTALAAEIERLSTERELPPVAPPTRTTDRSTMSGAPLWRLVRFADTVGEDAQAAVEAALQASGLLDAWVGPTGVIAGHDTFADPDAVPPVPGRSLAELLLPEPDTEVEAEAITRLLSAIAYGEQLPALHPAAIGSDGTWRLGNLTGSWEKAQPDHIGARARERARQRRIRELTDQITELDTLIDTIDTQLGTLASRRHALAAERDARPRHHDLNMAARHLADAESQLAAADRVVRQRVSSLSTREQAVTSALRVLTSTAAENGVPADRTALDNLGTAVDGFGDHAETWLDSHGELTTAQHSAESFAAQAHRSRTIAEEREQEAAEAEAQHRILAGTLSAVEGSIGAGYREILERIEQLRRERDDLRRQHTTAGKAIIALAERLGELNTQRCTDAQARDQAIEARDTAASRFRHLGAGNLPVDSGIELEKFAATLKASEGVRAALDAARLVAATWPTLIHAPKHLADALHRLSEAVHTCRDQLSDRADLELETDEEVGIFAAIIDGIRVGAAELLDSLSGEAERSRHDITEQERELFDQTLTGDTRRHLAARIRQAGELVDGMNARLERVRTASKVAVRLVWQVAPDLPPGTKAARDLLLKDPIRLTEADRESLHRFFRDRIEAAKADDTATSWEQQLAQIFDYTTWHQFVVKIDRANGAGWQLLTKKLHGALSGGEKAIVLHLPLFAAVAAHYEALPGAPRLILLDEVFVGVDTANRGQVFELLTALDLDLALTSDHEWCTYRQLDGIAIHQLITDEDGDDAVTTARFVWTGNDLLPDERLAP
jgi:uncharacterized protein (TIGR02680 family)